MNVLENKVEMENEQMHININNFGFSIIWVIYNILQEEYLKITFKKEEEKKQKYIYLFHFYHILGCYYYNNKKNKESLRFFCSTLKKIYFSKVLR
jgi:hypothetical protein